MNFLAHIYLSGDSEELLIGNFIADFIIGNQYSHFSEGVIQGIKLHRQIDTFTDKHPIARQSAKRLQPDFSKYSAVIVDIFYDHFLAKNWQTYQSLSLKNFSESVYQIFLKNHLILPTKVQEFLPHMVEHNWLLRYADLEGIERSLTGLSRRTKFRSNLDKAIENLKADYGIFEEEFLAFFPELRDFVNKFIAENHQTQ